MQELVSYANIKVLPTSSMQANEEANQGTRLNFVPREQDLTYKLNIKMKFKTLNKVNVGKPHLGWAFITELAHAQ